MKTFLTTKQLAERIHYHPRYITQSLKDSVLFEGVHYIHPFGSRKVLYIWEAIVDELMKFGNTEEEFVIPMASGGVCRG